LEFRRVLFRSEPPLSSIISHFSSPLERFVIVRFFHWLELELAVRVLKQDLDPPFGFRQPFTAIAREPHALFEKFKALFQGHVALFKLLYDRLKLIQRLLKSVCHTIYSNASSACFNSCCRFAPPSSAAESGRPPFAAIAISCCPIVSAI